MDEQLKKVCQAFRLPGTYLGYEAIQVGIVNQTYKVNVRLEDGKEKSFSGPTNGIRSKYRS